MAPLNAVGPISIGGSTIGESINQELGLAVDGESSLDDGVYRTFVGIAAPNEIALEDFYGFLSPVLVTRSGQYSTSAWETNISLGDLSAYYGQVCRLVFKYVSGSDYTGDIQIDNVRISRSAITTTYSFENNAEGWETTVSGSSTTEYHNLNWTTLATGTQAVRWNMDTAGTPSSGTGLTTATAGSYYVYAETSSPGYPNQTFWLRSPAFPAPFSGTFNILFDCARYGATIGTLQAYLEVVRTRRGTSYGTKTTPGSSGSPTPGVWYSPSNAGYTSGSTNTNTQPGPVNIWYRRHVIKVLYTQAMMSKITGFSNPAGTISRIRIYNVTVPTSAYQPLPSYTVGLKNRVGTESVGSATGLSTLGVLSNYYPTTGYNTHGSVSFNYTGGDLIIAFAWGMCPTGYSSQGQSWALINPTVNDAQMFASRTDAGGAYSINDPASTSYTNVPWIEFLYA